MKTCPNCGTQYTDDTLRFCLQDGAILESKFATGQPTVSFSGAEKNTGDAPTQPSVSELTQSRRLGRVTQVARREEQPRSTGRLFLVMAFVLGAALVSAVAGGVGLLIYLRDDRSGGESSKKDRMENVNTPEPSSGKGNGEPTVPMKPTQTRTPLPTVPPTPPVDAKQESADISRQIYSWKSAIESRNVNALMPKYHSSVQYFRRSGASREFIRADKQRAFNLYDSISITISDMNVSVGDSGDTATAVFDKEWVFVGARRSLGKVRQELKFRKVLGEWLISSERDIKVYYSK